MAEDDTGDGLGWLGRDEAGGDDPLRHDLATIWATVEMERALGDLGRSAGEAEAASADPLLGARIVIVPAADAIAPHRTALAEPSTEGRLAAFLARHGEGPAGRYVAVALDSDRLRERAAAAGAHLSRRAVGPFGPEVLVLPESPGGPGTGVPFLILVPAKRRVPSRP